MRSFVSLLQYFTFICVWFYAVQAPYRHGDMMLGGLFNVHMLSEEPEAHCDEIDMEGLGFAQAMIFAVKMINNDSSLLPNISLGYDIWDYCWNITKAASITYKLFKDACSANAPQSDGSRRKSIIALIGPVDSRTALFIGGFLGMLNVSSISGTTTSAELSSPSYTHVFRTVPSDTFLAKAMVDIIEHFNWSYVAAVGVDDSYGRNGVWSLVNEVASRESPLCIAMTEFIRHEAQLSSITYIVEKLKSRENIKVIILWIYGNNQWKFFAEVRRQNLTGRIWIISEIYQFESLKENEFFDSSFSTLEGSIGFEHHNFVVPAFKEHVKNILSKERSDYFLPEWRDIMNKDCKNSNTGQCSKSLVDKTYSTFVSYTIDAVYSVAHALDMLTKYLNVNDTSHGQRRNINLHDINEQLRKVDFHGQTGKIKFDEFGDRDSAIYDIFFFQNVSDTSGKSLRKVLVGKWEKLEENESQLMFHQELRWKTPTGQPPKSECSAQCPPGTRKSATSPCCWQCVPCAGGSISLTPGSESCTECTKGKIPNELKTDCLPLPSANLTYASIGGSLILAFGAIGVFIAFFSLAVICKSWNSPIVKASNRILSLALLLTILSLFSLIFINVFQPTDTICKIIYPIRYLTYDLCLSLLVVKILLISHAFQVPLVGNLIISSLTNRMQVGIVISLQVLLLVVLLPWLLLDAPFNMEHVYPERYIFHECKAYGMLVGQTLYLATCSLIFVQMFLSAFFSFKIKHIPENFSEAKRIAFSLYIFLFSLLCYHPVELSIDGWYVTVVDCVTTLLSAYGFLCCIFLPKIYILLFRPELNTVGSIREELTQFSFASSCVRVNPVFDDTNKKSHT